MTLRHLKIFVTVYQNNSITKASKLLHLAQPSVSLAIKELESYYGIRLFERLSRKLFVTEEGRIFYNYAMHITSLFDEMELKIRNWDSIGSIRIGSSVTIGNYLMPNYISQFRQIYPNIQVKVSIYNSLELEKMIMDNLIDFALVEGIVSNPQFIQIPFMKDRLCLICSPMHALASSKSISIGDLKEENLLLRERGSAGREILESIITLHQINLTIGWESISTQAIIKAVAAGHGISVLPYLLVKDSIDKKIVIEKEINDISLSRDYTVIYHKNKYLTNTAQSFIQLIQSNVYK